ncbi:MAG: HlyD family efflux transporter periplasmic adaptor subunit [Leptolyngbyaceae cyanobacterium SL_7_1]|nr:HlyD family efflux transporter periplasmic adaptor subunit [Leptolyngbyaceae cyanobacterium SL_7_1]
MPSQETVVEEAPPPQPVLVAALGRLEPAGEVVSVGGPTGDRIARLQVAEGDYVQQATVLAYLDSYDERLAERDYAASQLAEARTRLQAETQFGEAQIREAETQRQQIDRPQAFEIEAQRATIRQLRAELELAQIDLRRSQDLSQQGAISRQEYDQQVTEVRQRQEQLNNAEATLIRLESTRQSDLANAEAQVQARRAELERSQAQIEVESAARNLQLAEAKLERTLVRAPTSGEVLRIIAQQGEAIGQEGAILEMGDTRQMYVVAEVYESDIGRVQVGQPATITSRNGAFEQQLSGTVERIGSQIFKNDVLDDDPAANADARVVEVRIRLANSAAVAQLTNLQVDVQIDVD